MKIGEISKLKRKAISEAQREVNKIFKKYSKKINGKIAEQIPKGQTMHSLNGMCKIFDTDGNEIKSGNAWSVTSEYNPKMDFIAELQYGTSNDDIQGNFLIDSEIKG